LKRLADPRPTITEKIKATAHTKITHLFPLWKQLNEIALCLEVIIDVMRREKRLTNDDEQKLKQPEASRAMINAIRSRSDNLESDLAARKPIDIQKELG